jgi:hypothetical protein
MGSACTRARVVAFFECFRVSLVVIFTIDMVAKDHFIRTVSVHPIKSNSARCHSFSEAQTSSRKHLQLKNVSQHMLYPPFILPYCIAQPMCSCAVRLWS